jgi:putative holliday junction resolvase
MDIGDKRIGVALSDTLGILATPSTILEHSNINQDIKAILEIVTKNAVERIIIGLPRMMDGSIGAQADKVMAFVEELRKQTPIPIELRDERLTTISAQRLMREASTRKPRSKTNPKEKTRDDAAAAAIILQSYLDETR